MKTENVERLQSYPLKKLDRKQERATPRRLIGAGRKVNFATGKVMKRGLWVVELMVLSQLMIFQGWDNILQGHQDKTEG